MSGKRVDTIKGALLRVGIESFKKDIRHKQLLDTLGIEDNANFYICDFSKHRNVYIKYNVIFIEDVTRNKFEVFKELYRDYMYVLLNINNKKVLIHVPSIKTLDFACNTMMICMQEDGDENVRDNSL